MVLVAVGRCGVAALKVHKEVQDAERKAAMELWADHDLVFCQPDGKPIGNRMDWGEWSLILEAAGIPHMGVHAMRHSAATLALGQASRSPSSRNSSATPTSG